MRVLIFLRFFRGWNLRRFLVLVLDFDLLAKVSRPKETTDARMRTARMKKMPWRWLMVNLVSWSLLVISRLWNSAVVSQCV